MSDLRPRPGDERGASIVEFAILLPVLVMLVFGIIEFGRGYNAKVELTGAVREGARALALGETNAAEVVANAAPNLSPAPSVSTVPCPSGSTTGNAEVTATYDLTYTIPLVGSGTWPLTVTGVMRCGL
jgi:Flp pilus assembly protein TadG